MPPGPALGAMLWAVDRSQLNGHDLVLLMQARSRQLAYEQAELYADMVEVSYCPPGGQGSPVERDPTMCEFAADEIRVALTLTRRAADAELDLAWRLRERLPKVWAFLREGSIDVRRARTIIYGTDHLEVETARSVAELVLEKAPTLTTGQLAASIRRLAIDADPADAARRFEKGVAARQLMAEPNGDGTANLIGSSLAPDRVVAIRARIDALAKSLKLRNEDRTLDQLRADVFLDLLDGSASVQSGGPSVQSGRQGAQSGKQGAIDLHVDLTTLIEMNDSPGSIPGWGPVIADIARQLVIDRPAAEWRFTVVDSTGEERYGTTRRRPSAEQVRQVQARHHRCVFPGCRMPVRSCDIDHTQAWAEDGPTVTDNLAPLCRHDHRVKHEAGWSLDRAGPGAFVWTSRLGHTYVTAGAPP